MVGDCKLMMSVRLDAVEKKAADRLIVAYAKLSKRDTLPFHPMGHELDQLDRQELDEALFECLGVKKPSEQKELREKLYEEMKIHHSNKRGLELQAIENKRKTSRGGEPTPENIADEIWEEFDQTDVSVFPDDFLGEYDSVETKHYPLEPGERIIVGTSMFDMTDEVEVPEAKHVKKGTVLVDRALYDFGGLHQARYAAACLRSGARNGVDIPKDGGICKSVVDAWDAEQNRLGELFRAAAEERTSNEKDLRKVVSLLLRRTMQVAHDRQAVEPE